MQRIEKGVEPGCMADLRRALKFEADERGCDPTAKAWNHMKSAEQARAMRAALYAEQFGLCAYCQQRLTAPEERGSGAFTIEHIATRSACPERMFDWDNLVAVCPGRSGGHRHCDTLRGDDALDVSPLAADVEVRVLVGTVATAENGARILPMVSDDAECARQLDRVLGLNNAVLGGYRFSAREALRARLRRLSKRDPARARRFVEDRLRESTARTPGAVRPPFARVVADYCLRKLRQWSP